MACAAALPRVEAEDAASIREPSSLRGCAKTVWAPRPHPASDFRQVFAEVQRGPPSSTGEGEALPHPLEDITDLELEEIRQLKHPPMVVRRVMEIVFLILGESGIPGPSGILWATVVRIVVQTNFLRRVRRYDIEELAAKPEIVNYLCREYFGPGGEPLRLPRVRRASSAVVAFFGWTVALIAGVLPDWPADRVGGEEARRAIFEMEEERVRTTQVLLEERREAKRKQEQEEQEKKERKRQEEEKKEVARKEQARREEEKQQQAAEELARKEEEAKREEAAKQEREQQAAAAKRQEAAREEAARQQREAEWFEEICVWNLASNPERRFLRAEGRTVSFPSDAKANFVNVLTSKPISEEAIFFEFLMHKIGDEQWCGVTADPSQGGMRISGWNLRGWTYYCGRRWEHELAHRSAGRPSLIANKKILQGLARVVSGDTIGMLVDPRERTVAFTRNGEFQGACLLDTQRREFFAVTHLDAEGDTVELRARPSSEAPSSAREAIKALVSREN